MRVLEKYLGLPIPYIRISELFLFVISHPANLAAKTLQSKTSQNLYFFLGGPQQTSLVFGALNPASVISYRLSFFKHLPLHIEPGLHPFLCLLNVFCIPLVFLPSPTALIIDRLFITAPKIQFQSTLFLPFLPKHAVVTPTSDPSLSIFAPSLTSKVVQLQQKEQQLLWCLP